MSEILYQHENSYLNNIEKELITKFDINNVPKPNTLDELVEHLHRVFAYDSINVEYVLKLLRNYDSNPKEWSKFAKYDPYKYTRNLIDKGNGKFNLILLCWAESQGSSIHDHSNSHCFVKILDGELTETLYEWPKENQDGTLSTLKPINKTTCKKNDSTYINDTIGLHRVENSSHTKPAISLHIYIPPFDECQTFDEKTSQKRKCKVTFFSVDGNKINYCTANNEIAK